jgi:hypothetical protein
MFDAVAGVWLVMLNPVGHFLQHAGRMFIVRLLPKTDTLRQFEAGKLEAVFQERNPHHEKRA